VIILRALFFSTPQKKTEGFFSSRGCCPHQPLLFSEIEIAAGGDSNHGERDMLRQQH
jgi:hypothetical protein